MTVPQSQTASRDKPLPRRVLEVAVSICVLTLGTVVVGYGGWLLLTVSAKLGGPDPETDNGDSLRDRLLAWPARNREFMQNNGHGQLPWTP